MSLGEYLLGLAFALVTLGSAGAAAWRLNGCLSRRPAGSAGFLAFSVWLATILSAVHILPGVLGVLSREAVAVSALAVLALALAASRGRPSPEPLLRRAKPRAPAGFDEWAAVLSVALVGGWLLALVLANGRTPPVNVDAVGFHLPGVGEWIQDRSLLPITQFFPGIPTGQYPQSGDVMLLGAILPWENDAFVRLPSVFFLLVAAVSVYALGVELGARRSASLSFAALLLAVPAVHEPAVDMVMTDPPMIAMFGAGLLFLLRYHRDGESEDLLLAGLGLGLAFGTKWYGVTSVSVVLAFWGVACFVRSRRLPWRALGQLSGLVALAGGFWLLRNLIESGNPVSVPVGIGGLTIFGAPELPVLDQTFFTIAHYAGEPRVWSEYFGPAFSETLALPALMLVACAVVGGVAGMKSERGGRTLTAGALLVVALLVTYALTPSSAFGPEGEPLLTGANTRYAVPALIVAVPLGALLATRMRRWGFVLEILALVAIIHGLFQGYDDGLDGRVGVTHLLASAALVGLVCVAIAAVRRPLAGAPDRPIVRFSTAALAILALGVGGHLWQERYNDARYLGAEPAFDHVLAQPASAELEIGLAGVADTNGVYPVWPFFGNELQNRVSYIGEEEREVLFEYRDRTAFVAALRERDLDYLAIGLGAPARPQVVEERWAREAGFKEVARSERVVLLAREAGG